ncbi:MAG: class I SAM-dependent methyltransferase [Rhodothalassiaceae bacterium]
MTARFASLLLAIGLTGALAAMPAAAADPGAMTLAAAVENASRPAPQRARDRYRHPLETLRFFGIRQDMTVVEIWPGGQGGYYRRILEPYLVAEGHYVPVQQSGPFPDTVPGVPYGAVDMVLVFRAHGFTIYDRPPQAYIDAIHAMLKPGGVFGIVDHKGNEAVPQAEKGDNGYVNESFVIGMAEKAGFRLEAGSDVNRNPRDRKDHPRGVYSLPPTLAGTLPFTEAREHFLAIGESDRFTLRFGKPAEEVDTPP